MKNWAKFKFTSSSTHM